MYELPETQPEWAVEIMASWLIRFCLQQATQGKLSPFAEERYDNTGDRLEKMAQNAPVAFTEQILPIILELIRRNALRDEGFPPWKDCIWRSQIYSRRDSLKEDLMQAVFTAVRLLAVQQPEVLDTHLVYLRQFSDFKTAGLILAEAYAANGKHYADEAAQFLLSSSAWLDLGWSNASHWVSRCLIGAISPHCSDELLGELEKSVLSYYPVWERSYPKSIGRSQFKLIGGFVPERRSLAIRRRIGELQRQLGHEDIDPPHYSSMASMVGPPFKAQWEHLKDKDWLQAIATYQSEHRVATARNVFKGGARQLAQVLQLQAKQNPQRFARLLLRLPVDTNPTYFDDLLRSLSEAEKIDVSLIAEVCRYCHTLHDRPCGRSLANLLCAYDKFPLPTDILEMAAWYATNSSDPEDEIWQSAASGRQPLYGGEPEWAGVNSVRGSMAGAIANLLFEEPARLGVFRPYLDRMVEDPSIAVRTQVAYTLLPVLNVDRDHAIMLFIRLCEVEDDTLFEGQHIRNFLQYACYTHFTQIVPIIERMLASQSHKVLQNGAMVGCFAALITEDATLAERCMTGNETMREAAGEIAASNIASNQVRKVCEQQLIRLFNDEARKIRNVASQSFEHISDNALANMSDLVAGFIESQAFQESSYWFFQALERTTIPVTNAPIPDIICRACEKHIERLTSHLPDLDSRNHGPQSNDLITLILRLYEQTKSGQIKHQCLTLIDKLMEKNPYDLTHLLSERE